jgi:hypothetical protein
MTREAECAHHGRQEIALACVHVAIDTGEAVGFFRGDDSDTGRPDARRASYPRGVFRDDQAARAAYLDALERKAARVDELEARVRELEHHVRELEAQNRDLHATAAPPGTPRPTSGDAKGIYIDTRILAYVDALIGATAPHRTEGILSGARPGDASLVVDRARALAHAAGRPFVVPDDVRRSALEILPARIMMSDPEADPRGIVRAILDVVDVP